MRRSLLLGAPLLLALSACAELRMPWEEDNSYPRPVSSTETRHIDFIEQNQHVLYPSAAALALALIAFGILQAWRTTDLDAGQKANYRREIIQALRGNMGGMTGEQVSRTIGLEAFKTVKLLDEMVAESVVLSHTNTERLTVYRLRGVGPS